MRRRCRPPRRERRPRSVLPRGAHRKGCRQEVRCSARAALLRACDGAARGASVARGCWRFARRSRGLGACQKKKKNDARARDGCGWGGSGTRGGDNALCATALQLPSGRCTRWPMPISMGTSAPGRAPEDPYTSPHRARAPRSFSFCFFKRTAAWVVWPGACAGWCLPEPSCPLGRAPRHSRCVAQPSLEAKGAAEKRSGSGSRSMMCLCALTLSRNHGTACAHLTVR